MTTATATITGNHMTIGAVGSHVPHVLAAGIPPEVAADIALTECRQLRTTPWVDGSAEIIDRPGPWSVKAVRLALLRWEALRALLGHVALVDIDEVVGPDDVDDVLVRYAVALRVARARESHEGQSVPVVPVVDLAHQVISHQTCGASWYQLDLSGYTPKLSGDRHPRGPEHGRAAWHAARALLGQTEWAGGSGPLALRIAAEELEARGVAPEVISSAVGGGFAAHMEDRDDVLPARLEDEAAEAARVAISPSRSRRGAPASAHQAAQAEATAATPTPPAEPLAEWERELLAD